MHFFLIFQLANIFWVIFRFANIFYALISHFSACKHFFIDFAARWIFVDYIGSQLGLLVRRVVNDFSLTPGGLEKIIFNEFCFSVNLQSSAEENLNVISGRIFMNLGNCRFFVTSLFRVAFLCGLGWRERWQGSWAVKNHVYALGRFLEELKYLLEAWRTICCGCVVPWDLAERRARRLFPTSHLVTPFTSDKVICDEVFFFFLPRFFLSVSLLVLFLIYRSSRKRKAFHSLYRILELSTIFSRSFSPFYLFPPLLASHPSLVRSINMLNCDCQYRLSWNRKSMTFDVSRVDVLEDISSIFFFNICKLILFFSNR